MSEPRCICEFSDECDGRGVVQCDGCGGDFCVCAACSGSGEADCDGCSACEAGDELDFDQVCQSCHATGSEPHADDCTEGAD